MWTRHLPLVLEYPNPSIHFLLMYSDSRSQITKVVLIYNTTLPQNWIRSNRILCIIIMSRIKLIFNFSPSPLKSIATQHSLCLVAFRHSSYLFHFSVLWAQLSSLSLGNMATEQWTLKMGNPLKGRFLWREILMATHSTQTAHCSSVTTAMGSYSGIN